MGQDFCKSCVNNDESKKEGNLSNFPKISTNPQITTLQIPSSQLSNSQYNNQLNTRNLNLLNNNNNNNNTNNNNNNNFYFNTNNNNNNNNIYIENPKSSTIENSLINNQEYNNNFIDKNQLDKIIYNYRIKVIISLFRKLLKLKKEAHLTIISQLYKEENIQMYSIHGDIETNVNLFPEEEYLYIGSKFNGKKDGFGMQKFIKQNSLYFGYFRNDNRIGIGKFIDNNVNTIYMGEILNNSSNGFGIFKNITNNIYFEGYFKDNRKCGIGHEIYQDQSEYKGGKKTWNRNI